MQTRSQVKASMNSLNTQRQKRKRAIDDDSSNDPKNSLAPNNKECFAKQSEKLKSKKISKTKNKPPRSKFPKDICDIDELNSIEENLDEMALRLQLEITNCKSLDELGDVLISNNLVLIKQLNEQLYHAFVQKMMEKDGKENNDINNDSNNAIDGKIAKNLNDNNIQANKQIDIESINAVCEERKEIQEVNDAQANKQIHIENVNAVYEERKENQAVNDVKANKQINIENFDPVNEERKENQAAIDVQANKQIHIEDFNPIYEDKKENQAANDVRADKQIDHEDFKAIHGERKENQEVNNVQANKQIDNDSDKVIHKERKESSAFSNESSDYENLDNAKVIWSDKSNPPFQSYLNIINGLKTLEQESAIKFAKEHYSKYHVKLLVREIHKINKNVKTSINKIKLFKNPKDEYNKRRIKYYKDKEKCRIRTVIDEEYKWINEGEQKTIVQKSKEMIRCTARKVKDSIMFDDKEEYGYLQLYCRALAKGLKTIDKNG